MVAKSLKLNNKTPLNISKQHFLNYLASKVSCILEMRETPFRKSATLELQKCRIQFTGCHI